MTQPPPPPVVQPPPPPPPPLTAPPRSGGIPGWAIALIIGGVLLAVLLVIGMMVAILTPAMGRARNLARMTICQTHLQSIGMGIQMYRADYQDAMPPGMDALTQGQYMADASMFQCPCLQSGRKSDYFFHFPPADEKDPDVQTFIACDWKDNHSDGSRSVLAYDGSVRLMTTQAFERELKLPRNAAFAKALREEEGPQPAPARAPEERKPG